MNKKINFEIAVIDSGLGGLIILKSLRQILPKERFIYFADTINFPYGNKTIKELQNNLLNICLHLKTKYNIKIIILACNSATVSSIKILRENYKDISFVGLVPVIKPASIITKTKHITCLATKITINSKEYKKLIKNFAIKNKIKVNCINLDNLVEKIENGQNFSNILYNLTNELKKSNSDVLILGCTHYTIIKDEITNLLPLNIKVLDSTNALIKQTKKILTINNLIKIDKNFPKGNCKFIISGAKEKFIEKTNLLKIKDLIYKEDIFSNF